MAAPSRRRLAIDRHVRHQHSEASAEHHRRATVRELRERAQRRPLSRFSCCDGRRVPVLHGSSGSVSGLGWLGPAHLSEDDRSHPTDLLDLLHALGSAARRLRSWAKQVRTLVEPSRGHPPTRQHANTPTRHHVNTSTRQLPSPPRSEFRKHVDHQNLSHGSFELPVMLGPQCFALSCGPLFKHEDPRTDCGSAFHLRCPIAGHPGTGRCFWSNGYTLVWNQKVRTRMADVTAHLNNLDTLALSPFTLHPSGSRFHPSPSASDSLRWTWRARATSTRKTMLRRR